MESTQRATWRNLRIIMLSEKSQTQKSTHYVIHLNEILEHAKQIYSNKKQSGRKEVTEKGQEETSGDDGDISYLDCGSRQWIIIVKIQWPI